MFVLLKGENVQWVQHFGYHRTMPERVDFKSKDFGRNQQQASMHYIREY